jgi:hypothetical protein
MRQYNDTIGSMAPAGRMAIYAPIAAAAAYFGAPWALGHVLKMTGLDNQFEANSSPRFRSIAAILGALGTMGAVGSGNVANPFKHGTDSFVSSLFDRNYWDKHRDQVNQDIRDKEQEIIHSRYRAKGAPGSPLLQTGNMGFLVPQLDKMGADHNSLYYRPSIPINRSLNLIDRDPILNDFQKMRTADIINGAPDLDHGHTAGVDLTSSAVKFGIDYGSAYLFGKGVGAVLGMPDPLVTRLSRIGGLGAAVLNSGIFGEHT